MKNQTSLFNRDGQGTKPAMFFLTKSPLDFVLSSLDHKIKKPIFNHARLHNKNMSQVH